MSPTGIGWTLYDIFKTQQTSLKGIICHISMFSDYNWVVFKTIFEAKCNSHIGAKGISIDYIITSNTYRFYGIVLLPQGNISLDDIYLSENVTHEEERRRLHDANGGHAQTIFYKGKRHFQFWGIYHISYDRISYVRIDWLSGYKEYYEVSKIDIVNDIWV